MLAYLSRPGSPADMLGARTPPAEEDVLERFGWLAPSTAVSSTLVPPPASSPPAFHSATESPQPLQLPAETAGPNAVTREPLELADRPQQSVKSSLATPSQPVSTPAPIVMPVNIPAAAPTSSEGGPLVALPEVAGTPPGGWRGFPTRAALCAVTPEENPELHSQAFWYSEEGLHAGYDLVAYYEDGCNLLPGGLPKCAIDTVDWQRRIAVPLEVLHKEPGQSDAEVIVEHLKRVNDRFSRTF